MSEGIHHHLHHTWLKWKGNSRWSSSLSFTSCLPPHVPHDALTWCLSVEMLRHQMSFRARKSLDAGFLYTSSSEASCGRKFEPNTRYLITGNDSCIVLKYLYHNTQEFHNRIVITDVLVILIPDFATPHQIEKTLWRSGELWKFERKRYFRNW